MAVPIQGPSLGQKLCFEVSNLMRLLETLCETGAPGSWVAFRQVWRFFCRFAAELIRTDVMRTECL